MTKASPPPNSFPPFLFISFPAGLFPHGPAEDPKQIEVHPTFFPPYSKCKRELSVSDSSFLRTKTLRYLFGGVKKERPDFNRDASSVV